MADSPQPRRLWYWRGGREGCSSSASSPASSPARRDHDDAPGVRPQLGSTTMSAASREESEAAELVLEQLDEQWFCDNVVRWPSSRPGSPPGVINADVASPFRRRESLSSSASSQPEAASKARGWTSSSPSSSSHLNPSRPRPEPRRLSDGDHLLRRYLERDHLQRRASEMANSSSQSCSSLPQTPTKVLPLGDEPARFSTTFSPLSSAPLMGVTEDEEMENELFAKMVANRPARLTAINPGRFSRAPLQENPTPTGGEANPTLRKPQVRQRRRLKGTKSLTDLEYQELRGLKDLGFEVSKDDLTPHVVRMFPGLQRQGIPPYNSSHLENQSFAHPCQNAKLHPRVPATILWPRRPDSPSLNAPALDPSIDMKGQLKSWASEMASIVSIEC